MPRKTTLFVVVLALVCVLSMGASGAVPRMDGSEANQDTLLDEAVPEGAIWMQCRFDGPAKSGVIISKIADETNNSEDEFSVAVRPDGRIEFKSKMSGSGADLVSATTPVAGESVQVAISWGSFGRRLYIDGVEEASDTYPTAWGGGSVGDFTIGPGAACDTIEAFSTARKPETPKNRAQVEYVKSITPEKSRQGDVIEAKFAFSTSKPSSRRARIEVWLVKNDRTVSRADLSFSTRDWKPGKVYWVGPVKFDLVDAPEGKHVIVLKSKHTQITGLPKGAQVGSIVVKGHK